MGEGRHPTYGPMITILHPPTALSPNTEELLAEIKALKQQVKGMHAIYTTFCRLGVAMASVFLCQHCVECKRSCGLQRYPAAHYGTLMCTEVHRDIQRYKGVHRGIHRDIQRYTEVHRGTKGCTGVYTEIYRGTQRCTEVQRGAHRYTQYALMCYKFF